MANVIFIRVIRIENDTRHIVDPEVSLVASLHVAPSDRDPRLNCKIIVGYSIGVGEKNIVVPYSPHSQPERVVKPTWFPCRNALAAKYVLRVERAESTDRRGRRQNRLRRS